MDKIIELISKLRLTSLLQLFSYYLAVVTIFTWKQATIVVADFLTVKGIYFFGQAFIYWLLCNFVFAGIVHVVMSHLADFLTKRNIDEENIDEKVHVVSRFLEKTSGVIKSDGNALSRALGELFSSIYANVSVLLAILFQIAVLVNNLAVWSLFVFGWAFAYGIYMTVYAFNRINDLRDTNDT